jgi:hypothetical protein
MNGYPTGRGLVALTAMVALAACSSLVAFTGLYET